MAPRDVTWDEASRREYLLGFAERKRAKKARYRASLVRAAAAEKIEASRYERNKMKNYLKQLRRAKRNAQKTPTTDQEESPTTDAGSCVADSEEFSSHHTVQTVEDDGSFYGRASAKVRIEISDNLPV